MTKIIYIAGYGRSGSTILNIILGSHPNILSLGEVSLLTDHWSTRVCTCGQTYSECDFWGRLNFPAAIKEVDQTVRGVEKLWFLPRLIRNGVSGRAREIYTNYHQQLFAYVVDQTGKSILVDASKSARYTVGRFFALRRLVGQDVYVIHLVRNGLDTLSSLIQQGSNWALEGYAPAATKFPAIRSAFGWVNANVWAWVLGKRIGKDRYLHLSYENFVENPEEELKRLAVFCGFDPGPLVDKIRKDEFFQVDHLVGGNRLRLDELIKLDRGSKKSRRANLRLRHRLLFMSIGGWLQLAYGYGIW